MKTPNASTYRPRRGLASAAAWLLCALVPTTGFVYFLYGAIGSAIDYQELPTPLEAIFLLGLALLAAVFWYLTISAFGVRSRDGDGRLPPALLRVAAVFLILWTLSTTFMALESQVYVALLWAVVGLGTSIGLLIRARAKRPA